MSSKQQCDNTAQTTKVTETVETTQTTIAAGTQEHHGMMDKLKDQYAHADKKKLAVGGAVAAAAIGAAVAGGIALKHHHDAKVAAEHEAERHAHDAAVQSVVTAEVTTTTVTSTTSVYDSYKPTTNKGDNKVRYGDKIALKHVQTGRYLSFSDAHLVSKASNQKYVYASGWNKTENEYFQVLPGSGSSAKAGDIVAYNATIRFRHVKSKCMLHSHNHKSCQTTSNNEVTAYTSTDANDDWTLQASSNATCTELQADHQIRLVHVASKTALYTKEVKVTGYSGDATEVTTSTNVHEENASWIVQF